VDAAGTVRAAQPGYGDAPHPGAAIALTTKFMPLAFFYFFVKPKVAVDGYPVATDWGRMVIPVPPGDHRVDVYMPYVLPPRVGPADLTVSVAPGQTLELTSFVWSRRGREGRLRTRGSRRS
jgi:hypothetical protein